MMKNLITRLRQFGRDETGNVAIESVIFMPLILSIMAATFSFHDAFRHKSLNIKAAYTISDAISRQTDPINNA
jgi:Flp pilus assembly protein TadG